MKCFNCGKGIMWGHRVSHAKNRTNHIFKPNLQKKRIEVDGRMISVKLCTNCIKRMRRDILAAKKATEATEQAQASVV